MPPPRLFKERYLIAAWLFLTACTIGGIVALLYSQRWFLSETNNVRVDYLAFWLSGLSLALTVAGFIVTYQQLVKIVGSAQAVQIALDQARRSLASLACSGEIEKARMAFHDCTLDIRSGDAGSFQMKIIEARQSLVRIRERKLPQFNPLREDIERSIAEIAELSDSFDGPEPTDVKKLTGWLRNHVDLVDKLNVKLSEA